MRIGMVLLGVIFVSLLFIVACGSRLYVVAPTPIPTLAPATLPPSIAPGATPAATTAAVSAAAAQGKTVFDTNCGVCHNLTSEAKVGPGLAGVFNKPQLPNGKPVTDANMSDYLHVGGGAMPGFARIQGSQMSALLAFLKEATQ